MSEQLLAAVPAAYLTAAIGFALLIVGAESLVRGAVCVARRLNVSPLLIGVTIVAYGTSTPELVVSVNASLSKAYGIAVGNVVGSNILNILFILGLTAVIAPLTVSPRAIGRDALFALIAAGLFIWIVLSRGVLGFDDGVLFLSVLLAMTLFAYAHERFIDGQIDGKARFLRQPLRHPALFDLLLIAVGLALLILGADVLVHSSIEIARSNGISETVIGLTLVAVGTSLPELATSVVAALRRNPDIAIGNIVGSNIYNILAILGLASLLGPVQIDPHIVAVDMWVMLGATVALLLPVIFANRLGRGYGLFLLAGYGAYLVYLFDPALARDVVTAVRNSLQLP